MKLLFPTVNDYEPRRKELNGARSFAFFSLTISEEYLALQQNDLELWYTAKPTL